MGVLYVPQGLSPGDVRRREILTKNVIAAVEMVEIHWACEIVQAIDEQLGASGWNRGSSWDRAWATTDQGYRTARSGEHR